jgi:phosphoribosylglycinamide formyltransferase-1
VIGIITYDAPHRKTQDVVTSLLLNGHQEIRLVVLPWIEKEKPFQPIYRHRPSNSVNVSVDELCGNLKIEFSRVELNKLDTFLAANVFDHILIAGAGLLPAEISQHHKIINAHPGYLPNVKGLDALKWSIYNGQPIGVTTHYISGKTDEGELIERRIVPVYFEDTFHNVAYRVYETEIEMLVNSIRLVANGSRTVESLDDSRYEANKRMPHHYEIIMMNKFEELRSRSRSVRGAD